MASVALQEAKHLARSFNITLVSNDMSCPLPSGIDTLNVAPLRFDYLRRFSHATNEVSLAVAVRKRVAEHHEASPFSLLVCHGHVLGSLAGRALKRKAGLPYILVIHGDIFDRPRGTYDLLTTTLYKAVTRTAYRDADMVITLSTYMRERVLRNGASSKRTIVIPNGIDPQSIGLSHVDNDATGSRKRGGDDKLRVLYVGRLSREKAPDVLIDALMVLKEREIGFELIVCGDGPMRGQLEDKVGSYDLKTEVSFLGNIERRLLGKLYQDADVLCVPSVSDSFPGVVLESLVCGTPVIASRCGGMIDVIEPGKNGILVSAPTAASFAGALEDLARKPSCLRELTSNSAGSVWPQYSWDRVGSNLRDKVTDFLEVSVRPQRT